MTVSENPKSLSARTLRNLEDCQVIDSRIGRNEDGTLTTWVYDDADRLLNQQTASGYATFSYDSRDNILTKHEQGSNIMTFTVDAASQMVTMIQRAGLAGASNTTYTYDLTGNLVLEDLHNPSVAPSAFRTTHLWDPLNRNVGVEFRQGTDPIQLSTYTWDGDMRRRSRHEHGGSLTTILYDGDLPFMEKT